MLNQPSTAASVVQTSETTIPASVTRRGDLMFERTGPATWGQIRTLMGSQWGHRATSIKTHGNRLVAGASQGNQSPIRTGSTSPATALLMLVVATPVCST